MKLMADDCLPKKGEKGTAFYRTVSPYLHSVLTGENLEIGPKAGHKDGQREK
jgi:hypothetical protein